MSYVGCFNCLRCAIIGSIWVGKKCTQRENTNLNLCCVQAKTQLFKQKSKGMITMIARNIRGKEPIYCELVVLPYFSHACIYISIYIRILNFLFFWCLPACNIDGAQRNKGQTFTFIINIFETSVFEIFFYIILFFFN